MTNVLIARELNSDGTCRYNPENIGATDEGYVSLPEGDEEKLQSAVATKGPISVAIDASADSFRFYKQGVYSEKNCSTAHLDHAVLAVGYGTTKSGEDYWLIKNSWGKSWGMDGYMMMARNKNNMCGIATQATYPIV
ncbi:hypothetical protein J6590_071784 [Homalodisca vitripennis]|nr:hypothetical protein J6590_071784 [Homalodisca vitripennis]